MIAISIAAAMLLCGGGVWRWWPQISDRVSLLYWQRQCMTYTAPPDRVVFTTDPDGGRALLRADKAYRSIYPPIVRDGRVRLPYKEDTTQPPSQVWYRCDAWRGFPAGKWEPGPAFLHWRRAKRCGDRLVALELSKEGDDLVIYCRSFEPASLFDDGNLSRSGTTVRGQYWVRRRIGSKPLRLFAGQHDANDPASFSVRCESGEQSAIIRGRLCEDGAILLDVTEPWLLKRWTR